MRKILLIISAVLALNFAVSLQAEPNYNKDLLMGILWQQNSGEYSALCYQAFNAAESYLNSLPGSSGKAVVFDLDETMIDNSKYAAWMVKTGSGWSAESWEEWCKSKQAEAVPGALDFALFAAEKKFEIYYISNRPVSVLDSTIENLKSLGFPAADSGHVMLMEKTSDKTPRHKKIEALGYEIVLFAGDNLDDFDSSIRKKNNNDRRIYSDSNIDKFGKYWIVLPNSVYGTFEAAIRPDYYNLTPEGKASARVDMIKTWEK